MEKRRREKTAKSTSEITFVVDCVGSESDCSDCSAKALPILSFKQKINDIESDSEEECYAKEAKRVEGYCLVDIKSLTEMCQRIHAFNGSCSGYYLYMNFLSLSTEFL